MKLASNNFIEASAVAVLDPDLQLSVPKATKGSYGKRRASMDAIGYEHSERLRKQAAIAKRRALSRLPDLLELAEKTLTENGFNVLWARDAEEARQHALAIAKQHGTRSAIKSKSMVTEEIALNHALESAGIEVLETDLGEYVVQLSGDTPSHIVAPIIHKSKESVRDLFMDKLDMPATDEAAKMTHFARGELRPGFLAADMGITGGNFIVAETGSIGIVTNEGNARMATTLPDVHVAFIGIEKLVETLDEWATLVQMLDRSATGQAMTVYTHLINGPRRKGEADGSTHSYVILLDNGRSKIYASGYTESLACLRCGACLNGCPVYRTTGGHSYGWVYPGPIGAVITPLLVGIENAKPLPHASSLCGTCKQVCPVDIDIPRMLLDLRSDLEERNLVERKWRLGLKAWARICSSPALFRMAGKMASLRPKGARMPAAFSGWTDHRDPPVFASKPFRTLWKERQNG